jgi:hypothetical protein
MRRYLVVANHTRSSAEMRPAVRSDRPVDHVVVHVSPLEECR